MDVRDTVLGVAGRAGSARTSPSETVAPLRTCSVPGGSTTPWCRRRNRHCQAVRRDRPRERHLPATGARTAGAASSATSIAAMLTCGVRVGTDREPTQHRAFGRPCPCERRRAGDECRDERRRRGTSSTARVVLRANMRSTVPRDRAGGNACDSLVTETRGRACCGRPGQARDDLGRGAPTCPGLDELGDRGPSRVLVAVRRLRGSTPRGRV